MADRALILTYHGIEASPGPLWIDPALFAAQLDCLRDCGATTMTLGDLANGLAAGTLPPRAVAITFDDGLQSVVEVAAPQLVERDMRATIFCVAGRLGYDNRWPTEPDGATRRPLAAAGALRELVAAGFEIGAHGMQHLPLRTASAEQLTHEIIDSKNVLEEELGARVSSFAYPYGAMPGPAGRAIVGSTYGWACTTRPEYVSTRAERSQLPRVDIHYLRRLGLLRRAVSGTLEGYIGFRRRAAWVRRLAVKDYVPQVPA
ncbi:MAG: polysaccharide deacetylase family protein [Solirubrobacteraceae bacterium]